VALKVRELLQPAAKERQREAGGDRKSDAAKSVSADLREAIPPTDQRKTTAQAAKATGASARAVEQAARVAKVAPKCAMRQETGGYLMRKG
jgi:hypothetical protein